MCLLLSSNNLNVLWVQNVLLLQPQIKGKEFIQVHANFLVEVVGAEAWLGFIHPGDLESIKNDTKEWLSDKDWIKQMLKENLIAGRTIKEAGMNSYDIWYEPNAHKVCKLGPVEDDNIDIWPDKKARKKIMEDGQDIPLTKIVIKGFPLGSSLIRISAKTKSGVYPTNSQTSFRFEGPNSVLSKLEIAADQIRNSDLRDEFFKIIYETRKYYSLTKDLNRPRYDMVALSHPECPTIVETLKGDVKYERRSIEWPLPSGASVTRLFIFYPLQIEFDIELLSEVCPKIEIKA